jgi:hypothetical protein
MVRRIGGEIEVIAGGGAQVSVAGGKSELRRAGCWLMASRGDSQDSATENKPPVKAGKGETVR